MKGVEIRIIRRLREMYKSLKSKYTYSEKMSLYILNLKEMVTYIESVLSLEKEGLGTLEENCCATMQEKNNFEQERIKFNSLLNRYEEILKEIYGYETKVKNVSKALPKIAERYDRLKYAACLMSKNINDYYIEVEFQANYIMSFIEKLEFALSVGVSAKKAVEKTIKLLENTKGWAAYDIVTKGSMLVYVGKYDNISYARRKKRKTTHLLKEFEKELGEIVEMFHSKLDIEESTSGSVYKNILRDTNFCSALNENIADLKQLFYILSAQITGLENEKSSAYVKINDLF